VPEGHTLHRLARRFTAEMRGQVVRASSPQGRFAAGAALVDGRVLERAEAHGKHLWLGFGSDVQVHVHLGLYGTWTFGPGEPPPPRGAVRLRLSTATAWADLRGPTACEVQTPEQKDAVHARLGPDPLRRDADPSAFAARLRRSRSPVAGLLMQQEVVAGVGNVYRAESLFRARLDPYRPGRSLGDPDVAELWRDLVLLLRDGVRRGRIVTTLPADRARRGRVGREDAHYVYRRTGLPCRVCGTPVATDVLAARNLYWCPVCQAAA
jgi:endonuclease-8